MFEIGRLCVKTAGRDARKKCVIIDVIDNNYVLIDGETRRRKCSIKHLEPLNKVLKVKKGMEHNQVIELFEKEGIILENLEHKKPKEKPKEKKSEQKPSEKTTAKKK